MKKIYKTLAVAAFALMANVAFGQNLKVTSGGEPVANGDVIEIGYEIEVYDFPEMEITFYKAKWDPHLEASTVEGNALTTLTVTSVDDSNGFTACWPDFCKEVPTNGSLTTNGTLTTNPADLQIHKEVDLDSKDEVPTSGGTVKVLIQCGGESMELTVKALLKEAGVGENLADSNEKTTYYTLEGIRVDNPTKGIYVARKGGKAKLIRK